MQINRHVNGGRFQTLTKVLKAWVKLNRQYVVHSHDAPWSYNERADISILSAAAWVAGGIALEEFSTKKGHGQSKRSGRCDIYIRFGNSEFACEAKSTEVSLNVSSSKNLEYIKKELNNAFEDAKCLQHNLGRRFGICFITVCVTRNSASKFDMAIKELQEGIVSAGFDAIAWSFPQEARNLSFAAPSWRSYYCPGSILVMREV